MKTIFLLIIFSFSLLYIAGQNNDSIIVKRNGKGIVEYVKFPSPQSPESKKVTIPETAKAFFANYLKPAPATTFVLQPQKQRNENFRHEHYDQFYNGVKVDGAGYNFHFEKGRMYLAHGNFIKIEGLSTTPSITREEAKQAFADYKEIPVEEIAEFKADLLIKEILNISGKDTVYSPVLVYQVYLITGHPNNDEIGYIDAQNGKVLFTEPSITGYSATGTFETRYNGTRQATTQHYNNTYNLCDSSRNAVIHTWDLNGSANINSRVELTDADNNWTANEYAASEDDMGLDIHWALQEIYDYLLNEHSISSYDDNNFDIDAYFHYGSTDNDRDNAFWNLNLNVLLFGDGAVKFNPVASLDAVAHEYGHGITDFQIGWAYSGDLQIFHEGLSDIWGIILENRISPSSVWEIGEGVILNYDCIRNIQNPEDPNAETEISDTYLSSTYNAGNQYVKSGVFSHWFYLLVNGSSGTNDNGNSYTVYGIGMDAAEDLIVEAVFNNYLDNQSTYPGIRTQTINAAASGALFGSNSFHTRQVEAAWYAVGVGTNPTQPTISGPSVVCYSGSTFTANNPPNGSSIKWVTSSNLSIQTGGTTATPTIRAKYSSSQGEGWVQVNFISNGYETPGPRYPVWVGEPDPSDFYITAVDNYGSPIGPSNGPFQVCPNNYYTFYLYPSYNLPESHHKYGISDIDFYFDFDYQIVYGGYGWAYIYVDYIDGNSYGVVYVDSECGGYEEFKVSNVNEGYCGYLLSFSPNPATGETTLTIETNSSEKTFDESAEWDLEVYSETQLLKTRQTGLRGQSAKIQTAGWKEGVYLARVNYNGEVLTGKLVVKR